MEGEEVMDDVMMVVVTVCIELCGLNFCKCYIDVEYCRRRQKCL